jgi:hypothetical protein
MANLEFTLNGWKHLNGCEQISSIASFFYSYNDDDMEMKDEMLLIIETLSECGDDALPLAKAYLIKVLTAKMGEYFTTELKNELW